MQARTVSISRTAPRVIQAPTAPPIATMHHPAIVANSLAVPLLLSPSATIVVEFVSPGPARSPELHTLQALIA